MLLVKRAEQVAQRWHRDQRYGDASYYDGHLKPVAGLVEAMGGTPSQIAAAWLHDVLEDTFCPREEIRFHFGQGILDTIDSVTRREDESYDAYMRRVALNPSGVLVKLADSTCNLTASVIAVTLNPRDSEAIRRINKYIKNVGILSRLI